MDDGYDALILAGGAARRLGGADKPALDVGGRSMLEHVVGGVRTASRVVVVGPTRPLTFPAADPVEVLWCVEDPPGGGPVAAIASGLIHVVADVVIVLAADLPWVAPAVPVLRAALRADSASGVAVLVDASGRANNLAAAWRRDALRAACAGAGELSGAPVRALLRSTAVTTVADPAGWGRDCDTWPDVRAARAQASRSSPA